MSKLNKVEKFQDEMFLWFEKHAINRGQSVINRGQRAIVSNIPSL